MRPLSLRAIMAIYVSLFLVALLAVRAASYSTIHDALGQEVDRRLAGSVAEIVGAENGADLSAVVERIAVEQQDHDSADLFYMLVDKGGRHLAGALALSKLPPIGYSDFGEDAQVKGVSHGRALTRGLANGAVLVVASDNDMVNGFDRLLTRAQLFTLGTTALIVIGGAAGIMLVIRSRMRSMQRTVDAVIAGDLQSRIPLDGSRSEFDQQAAAFNRMLDRIDELMASIKHVAKDVTHELRSPLARLRVSTAALLRQSEQNPLGPGVADILEQTDQILDIFSSILRLWEIEGGDRRERFVTLEMGALVKEVGDGLQAVAEDAGYPMEIIVKDAATIHGDINLLRQMLVNLIENAIHHTSPGTHIAVTMEKRDRVVAIVVRDTGPGIPAEQRNAVIRRFGRFESSRARAGQGLGLTLVDAIARLHNGALSLEDADPGLRAVVEIPHYS